jgi:5-methyltetrahydrofolate--homocysteine methyltransferase
MVDKDMILDKAEEVSADIVAVSGLITPSLYQMEEICREMYSRQMTVPLFIGGATTSAVHTAVKLAPLYGHVFHGADASAAAVMAKKCMMDRKTFEEEQIAEQQKLRDLYYSRDDDKEESEPDAALSGSVIAHETRIPSPADIPARELTAEEVMPYFDWKMFYAIWGVKYGSHVP